MSPVMTRQDELWKEDTGGTIRCHECDWTGQADTIADALAKKNQHYDEAHAMTDRELLDALVEAIRPLMDPDICSPFSSAWELDTHHIEDDGQTFHARIKALIGQYDGLQQSESTTHAGGGL